jgi:hypothetical protein
MNKSNSSKRGKNKSAPDMLAKTGKKAGIELTEGELGKVAGGFKWKLGEIIVTS